MQIRPALVVARREVRLLVQDPMPLILLMVVPLAFLAFLKPVLFIALIIEGYPDANGSEQAVPGGAATFSLLMTGLVGLSFFREHGWGVWDRLRASPATTGHILIGKLIPLYGFALAQTVWVFAIGFTVFGLRTRGPVIALVVLAVVAAAAHLALGLLVVAVARTIQQVNALANLGAAVFAGLGGALVPAYLLPGWVRTVGPFTPTHWVMAGYRSVILDGRGLDGVWVPVVVLLGFAAGLFAAATARLSVEEAKSFWA